MSDSQTYEDVTVAAHGVTVSKRFEPEEFPVPAIAFRFSSERDEPVTVELVDAVPESVAVEDLGFHPEYGSQHWTIDQDRVTFERELGPGVEYTTVYGIRGTGTDDVERFLAEPDLATVDPPLVDGAVGTNGADGTVPESDDELVGDVLSEENADDEESTEERDEEIETLDLADPNDEEGRPEETTVADAGSDSTERTSFDDAQSVDPGDEAVSADESDSSETSEDSSDTTQTRTGDGTDTENLVAALAEEIREDDVSSEDVELLRQALDLPDREDGSIEARVQRIQRDVSDLRAYTDALEEFLDENGGADRLVSSFREDVETLEETVSNLDRRISATDERLSSVDGDLQSFESNLTDLNERVAELSEDVGNVPDDVVDELDELQATVEDLEDRLESEGDVAERVAAIETDIEELRTWQEKIKKTFGS